MHDKGDQVSLKCCTKVIYRCRVKESPTSKECPPPTFAPISCIGPKFTQMSAHATSSMSCYASARLLLSTCIVAFKSIVSRERGTVYKAFSQNNRSACTSCIPLMLVVWRRQIQARCARVRSKAIPIRFFDSRVYSKTSEQKTLWGRANCPL